MSCYAALQSLRTLVDPGRLLIINNRSQLHEKVIFLLHFLENSSASDAALETKMREAAYEAQDLIEFQISRSHISFRQSLKYCFRRFRYAVCIFIIYSYFFPTSFTQVKPIPFPIQVFLRHLLMPLLFAVAICTVSAVLSTLFLLFHQYGFPAINLFPEENQLFRRLLYDFDIIVNEAIQIKQASGDTEMSAHAALVSLRQALDCSVDRICYNRGQLESINQNVSFLMDFLGNSSTYRVSHKSELEILELKTRDAVYKANALLEFQIPAQFTLDSDRRSIFGLIKVALLELLPIFPPIVIMLGVMFANYVQMYLSSFPQMAPLWIGILVGTLILIAVSFGAFVLFTGGVVVVLRFVVPIDNHGEHENQELRVVIDDFSTIVRNLIAIKDAYVIQSDLPTPVASSRSRNVVVGLGRDLELIKDHLARNSSKLEVVSIVGMGGIGKTTLAQLVYDDPYIVDNYKSDIRAWITVPQGNSLCQVLLGLLGYTTKLTEEMLEENEDRLSLRLYQNLFGRRYLIVMDNVWSTEIWDFLRRSLPDTYNGSRVILTSQLSNVASHPNSCTTTLHQMQCLDPNESWNLLCQKVFLAENCPLELESIGREIATSCGGLPLAIVAIGGLLRKNNTSEFWRDIAKNLKSILRRSKEGYLEILGLSYNHLPHHLKPCFLYMGVFLGESEIPVSRLISLWVAEGFLKPSTSKTLEEVAEDNLKDLIDRNLVVVRKWSCNGKIRTCSMHGLLRDVSQQKAREENFFHIVDRGGYVRLERRDETPRRLSIRSDALRVDARHDLISRYHNVRSFLCTSELFDHQPVAYIGFVYLRVLDVIVVHFSNFPEAIIRLVFLRYLAFHCDGPLPVSMSKLKNLETIIHHHCSFRNYPLFFKVIWTMKNVRHIYVKPGCYLSNPLGFKLPWNNSSFEHLQTLVGIRNFKLGKGIIKRIPNVKKLGISYDVSSCLELAAYQLESLVDLNQLENLKIIIKYNDEGSGIPSEPPKLAFPQKLKKLSLSGGGIAWESIGALPNLEALKLRRDACCGSSWETVEEEFPQLRFLLLEGISLTSWETEASHFPLLERLVIRWCGVLEEIPWGIGDIPTLETMELVGCHPCAQESAKQIQKEQESMGNVGLKVRIS